MHALRLRLQGVELLTTGRITLAVPEPDRAYLRSIRRGERPLAEVIDAVTDAENRLVRLRDSAAVPDQPAGGRTPSAGGRQGVLHTNPSGSVNGPASPPILIRCDPVPSGGTPASLARALRP